MIASSKKQFAFVEEEKNDGYIEREKPVMKI
jgi:hypothetical protein